MTIRTALDRLVDPSVSIWLVDMSWAQLTAGGLQRLIDDRHITDRTSDPPASAKPIEGSDVYDGQLADLARRPVDVSEALRAVATYVRAAHDVMPSVEVDARIAHDSDAHIAEACALWWLADRTNIFVKIPAIVVGLAISRCLAEGGFPEAHVDLDVLRDVGIDYADLARTIEDETIAEFIASWTELERRVRAQLNSAATR